MCALPGRAATGVDAGSDLAASAARPDCAWQRTHALTNHPHAGVTLAVAATARCTGIEGRHQSRRAHPQKVVGARAEAVRLPRVERPKVREEGLVQQLAVDVQHEPRGGGVAQAPRAARHVKVELVGDHFDGILQGERRAWACGWALPVAIGP